MGVQIYDLGDLTQLSEGQIAQRIIKRSKSAKKYESTHLYRGLAATPEIMRRIKKYGTDRHLLNSEEKAQRAAIEMERIETLTGRLRNTNSLSIEIATNPNKIWAAEEKELTEVIKKYAIGIGAKSPDTTPIILAYRREALDAVGGLYLYEFKKSVKPIDALVAGFCFK